jgi:alcohol dehydrogenase class IV
VQSQLDSGTDDDKSEDEDGDQKEESMDEIADLPSQNEMKRELIIAIEEELREQDALKKQNEELQRQIILMDPSYEQ